MGNTSGLDNQTRELLEQISKKILNSPALNGGFDKLVVTVGQIKEKQDEAVEKIEKLSVALYQPKEGLYSKMQTLEHDLETVNSTIESHFEEDNKELTAISKSIKDLEAQAKDTTKIKDTTERLKRIGGEDLQEISDLVNLKKNMTKILWALITLVIMGAIKLLWELAQK
jgi:chromosome segregation ATPase